MILVLHANTPQQDEDHKTKEAVIPCRRKRQKDTINATQRSVSRLSVSQTNLTKLKIPIKYYNLSIHEAQQTVKQNLTALATCLHRHTRDTVPRPGE